VGAVNATGQIASFSSFGYPGKVKPNIVSMGAGTVLAGLNGQTVIGNGTSYSNPNVAGLIACLWQAFPTFNNMQILDAVYKSADRYQAPTERFGYGIPNFKTAYRILKKQLNETAFGADWLRVTPNPFTNEVHGTFVAQVDGNARIEFVNSQGQVLFSKPFFTEKEEVYNYNFEALDGLPGGTYVVRYADSLSSKTVTVAKESTGGAEWLRLLPGTVFTNSLNVYLTAPENGTASIRLLDANGSKLFEKAVATTAGQSMQVDINTSILAKGVYYVQYISTTQKRVIPVLKL
jgi:subtilisin family serine protease